MTTKPSRLATVLAFGIIYVVWGSTYLAIRIAVESIPPLLAAGLRFGTAGLLLLGYALLRGEVFPTRKEWANIGLVSLFLFVVTYGALFWAERLVPSGIASVLAATVPLSTYESET